MKKKIKQIIQKLCNSIKWSIRHIKKTEILKGEAINRTRQNVFEKVIN